MIGGGGRFQKRQRLAHVRRSQFAFQIHVGQIGLGGGQPRHGGAHIDLFGLVRVLRRALALAQHHAEVAHGGQILEAQIPPDLERLLVIARVIGGDAGVENRGKLGAGMGGQGRCGCEADAERDGKVRKNLVYSDHDLPRLPCQTRNC